MAPGKSPEPTRRAGGSAHEAGIRAWERGDWLEARRFLRVTIESNAAKADRLEAGRILHALEPDRFALGLAAVFLLILASLFAWLAA